MKRRAFTLIELLLAVMLMALVLGVIYGVVWAGVKSRLAMSAETDALCRVNAAIDVIQGDLQRISCRPKALRILPLAQSGGLIMEITAMPPSANDMPEKICIFTMPQSGRFTPKLVRHIETDSNFAEACKAAGTSDTLVTSASITDDNDFEILLDNVETFKLRCNNGAWLENSYDVPSLPAVVEITLAVKTDKGKILSVTRVTALPVQAGPLTTAAEGGQ